MPVEEIISRIKKQDAVIFDAMQKREKLMKELESADMNSYEWVSVKKASEILQVSLSCLYQRIEKGELQVKYIGAKKFVKKNELFTINDK